MLSINGSSIILNGSDVVAAACLTVTQVGRVRIPALPQFKLKIKEENLKIPLDIPEIIRHNGYLSWR